MESKHDVCSVMRIDVSKNGIVGNSIDVESDVR